MQQQIIGKYFQNAVDNMNNPNSTYIIPDLGNINIYVAPPSASMSCQQVQLNYQNLVTQAAYWTKKALTATIFDRPNLLIVASFQTNRKNSYLPFVEQCNYNQDQTTPGDTTTEPPLPPPTVQSSGLALLVAGAAGLFILYKTNQNRKTKRNGKK